MSVLDRIVAVTRDEVARRRERVPLGTLEKVASARPGGGGRRGFARALAAPGISVIAEHKRRSPSAGTIREGATVEEVVGAYERGGAAALSVLTEGPHFGGSLDDLRAARAASALPILRKDFVVDAYQLYEAAAAGADAVLLIVAALDAQTLSGLHEEAGGLDLDALVEVHDAAELEVALDAGAAIVGVNNRNLRDFTVDVHRTFELRERVPAGRTVVSESGIATRDQVAELERAGVDAVLVGELLMRAPDPAALLHELQGSFRRPEAAL